MGCPLFFIVFRSPFTLTIWFLNTFISLKNYWGYLLLNYIAKVRRIIGTAKHFANYFLKKLSAVP